MISVARTHFLGGKSNKVCAVIVFLLSVCLFSSTDTFAQLRPRNVLILVNSQSATSSYVAKMYREYYPEIEDVQVLELSLDPTHPDVLPDSSGPKSTPADEIITRQQYDTQIAEPVRQHLLDHNLIEQIMVIMTTAGMPYRIEDTNYGDVIYPAGSNYNHVLDHCGQIDAASVESELTCLWICNEGPYSTGLSNRIVNPYHGYRGSSVTLFQRSTPDAKAYQWNCAVTSPSEVPPVMEGRMPFSWPPSYGTVDRSFHAGDMYLTCRLDGPKLKGQSAVFAVREMLERSQRASSPTSGVSASQGVIVIDDCPDKTIDQNRIFNLDGSMNYCIYSPDSNNPPNASTVLTKDDYSDSFDELTNGTPVDPTGVSTGVFDVGYGLKVILDRRSHRRSCQVDLEPEEMPVYFCCYGKNGDEGSDGQYLMEGFEGGALFDCVNGAVFTSLESFNASTLFSEEQTLPAAQGKIVDFISIGGSAAVGHAFEPISTAAIDNLYLIYNLFADGDGDGIADLTYVESVFTAIPFLSWSEVAIGDPLMRIAYGPGQAAWSPLEGDVNMDGNVNIRDYVLLRNLNMAYGNPGLYDSMPEKRERYCDSCDLNHDGFNNIRDIVILRNLLYSK